jgi:hypothetical protein
MNINIIHLFNRIDRWEILQKELKQQAILEYKIWGGVTAKDNNTTHAISKAHKQIVRFAKESGLSEIIMLKMM